LTAKVAGNGRLYKCNTHFGVSSPYRTTRAANSVEHDIEAHWNSVGRGNLQARTCIRKISNGTIKLWSFVTEDDLRCLQHALAEDSPFFLHDWKPKIESGLGDLVNRRKSTG